MSWQDIGKNHLEAAKLLVDRHPRSAASRAYYAAHVVLAEALVRSGTVLSAGRQTPSHRAQAKLISIHFRERGSAFVRRLKTAVSRLYSRRIDADYLMTVTIDSSTARDCVRDASTVFVLLEVRP
jgi:uncharacterized protein (UPF0332 family)